MTWRPGPPAADLDVHFGPGNAWPGAVVPISAIAWQSPEFSLWNPPVLWRTHVIHIMSYVIWGREIMNENYIYRSFIMYMYVPKNANNTSQNSQCVCVGVAVVFANDICKHARQMPTASPESLANITCIKDLGCNATFKWLKQLHVMLLLEVSDDRWRRRWDFSGGATL